jgi:hypothetical protein
MMLKYIRVEGLEISPTHSTVNRRISHLRAEIENSQLFILSSRNQQTNVDP